MANARNYAVQYQVAGGEWISAGLFQSTRGLVVSGLTPGTMYTFQVRAVGGSTGHSDWSDPRQPHEPVTGNAGPAGARQG